MGRLTGSAPASSASTHAPLPGSRVQSVASCTRRPAAATAPRADHHDSSAGARPRPPPHDQLRQPARLRGAGRDARPPGRGAGRLPAGASRVSSSYTVSRTATCRKSRAMCRHLRRVVVPNPPRNPLTIDASGRGHRHSQRNHGSAAGAPSPCANDATASGEATPRRRRSTGTPRSDRRPARPAVAAFSTPASSVMSARSARRWRAR
jgi:hypothetical protein